MKKYVVNYYWAIHIEANNEEEARDKADEIAKGDIIDFNDLSCDVEEVKLI